MKKKRGGRGGRKKKREKSTHTHTHITHITHTSHSHHTSHTHLPPHSAVGVVAKCGRVIGRTACAHNDAARTSTRLALELHIQEVKSAPKNPNWYNNNKK